jgi:predicted permease
MAVRLAIGASRGRILRQLLAESLVLAVLGGSLGVLFAVWAGRLLSSAQLPLPVPLAFDYALDGRVLAFAILASFLTTTLFGLAPALQAAKSELVGALRGEAGVLGGRARRFHLRDVLVGGQLALSVVLLVAGALLLRALFEASHIRPGFEPDRLAILSFNLKMNGYTKEQTEALHKRVTERLRSVPGAEEVALVSRAPLGSDINMEGIRIKGHHDPEGQPTTIDATYVEPAYFPALGLRAVDGRLLTEADGEGKPGVVVINEAMARRYWPDRSAVGERVYTEGFDGPSFEVVGVVADYKVRGLGEDPRPYLHFAWRQRPSQSTTLLVRSAATGAPLLAGLKAAVLELEPAVVFTEEGTVADLLRLTLAPTRVGALLLAAFGGLALLLASIGLYGVVAQSVAQRTREIGVRVALGADARSVLRTVLGRGMRLASAGALAGLLAAAVLTRTLSSLLYGVSAVDPLAYLAAVLVLLAVAALANFIPARRAARVDPMVALRHE